MNNRNGVSSAKFLDFVSGDNIVCHSEAQSGKAMIHELIHLLADRNATLDAEAAEREVFEREMLFPTVIAPGLAMPHARLSGLDRPLVALGTSAAGVEFGGVEPGEKVRVVVLVLSPSDDPGLHLQVVSALAHEFGDAARITQLADLRRISEVMAFFQNIPLRLPDYLKVADLTSSKVHVLLEQDTLALAIRRFAETRARQMAVLDDDGDLRGMIALEDILRYSMPEHMLWLDDLTPIYNFEPFADMLANAGETKVADVMREEFIKVADDVPAVQLAKLFLTNHADELLVVDKDGRLRGMVAMRDFCAKLFWE